MITMLEPPPPVTRRVSLWQRLKLLAGRPRRLVVNLLAPRRVKRALQRRQGECLRCGACCRMGATCRFLDFDENGLALCRVYDRRLSPNCRTFPIGPMDIRDRDVVADGPCGYRFPPGDD